MMAGQYSYYDPNQAGAQNRDSARARMMALIMSRQQDYNEQRKQAEAEMAQARREQELQQQNGLKSMWGTVGQGASMGAGVGMMFGNPLAGAAIGGGAGLLLGSLGEMSARKDYERRVKGHRGYSGFNAFKDTFARAPTGSEGMNLLGGLGSAAMAAGQGYQKDQMAMENMQNAQEMGLYGGNFADPAFGGGGQTRSGPPLPSYSTAEELGQGGPMSMGRRYGGFGPSR
jgi:hypothetical protein